MSGTGAGDRSNFVHLTGSLCNRQVSFLVDSGASNNFISGNLLKALDV